MKTRSLALLAAATVIAVGAAVAVTSMRTSDPLDVPVGQRLFPDLPARAETVTRIEITRGRGSVALAQVDGRWVAADRGNYPANAQRVRELVVDMAQLTTLEPKSSTPSLYASMEVEDPTGDDPRSGLVRLLDARGGVVAALIVGRSRSGRNADDDTVFVRRAGEPQSWLVRGRMSLPRDAYEWLERFVIDVERPRVQQVRTVQPDGAVVTVARESPAASDFTLQDVPDGRRAKPAVDINQVGQAFDRLELEDVRPAEGIAFVENAPRAEVRTFDGLTVTAQLAESDGQTWVRFAARGAPPAPAPAPAAPAPAAPGPPGEQPAEQSPPQPGTAAPATPPPGAAAPPSAPAAEAPATPAPATPPAAPPPRDVAREAEEINARLGRWAYRLPAYRVEIFKRKLEDLLEARSS